ncbi:MAG: hypothetical protein JWO30_4777 [Fibrobacteres bacterium]|nr:hypothetical protein [Fibrobacterota bacterium]
MAAAAFRNFLFTLAACATVYAAAPQRPLDQGRIRSYYHDGEFDKVIKDLEGFLKSGKSCPSADSLFIEKHLAVVYAANPGTRELGRYHMFRMLDLAPGSDLLDMFVGEEVDAVFEKVRKEYSLRTAAKKPAPAAVAKAAAPLPSAPKVAARQPIRAPLPAAKPVRAAAAPVPAKPAWETAAAIPVAAKSSWENPGAGKPKPVRETVPAPAPAKPSWDSFVPKTAGAPAPAGSTPNLSGQTAASGSGTATSGSRQDAVEFHSSSASAWKEPGLWIGGGAALAVVAFTLFYSGSSHAPDSKTYFVPANVSN